MRGTLKLLIIKYLIVLLISDKVISQLIQIVTTALLLCHVRLKWTNILLPLKWNWKHIAKQFYLKLIDQTRIRNYLIKCWEINDYLVPITCSHQNILLFVFFKQSVYLSTKFCGWINIFIDLKQVYYCKLTIIIQIKHFKNKIISLLFCLVL